MNETKSFFPAPAKASKTSTKLCTLERNQMIWSENDQRTAKFEVHNYIATKSRENKKGKNKMYQNKRCVIVSYFYVAPAVSDYFDWHFEKALDILGSYCCTYTFIAFAY